MNFPSCQGAAKTADLPFPWTSNDWIKMGNICCAGGVNPNLAPGPRRQDSSGNPELMELRLSIDQIFHFLKTSNSFLSLSSKQAQAILAAIATNKNLVSKIREGLRPIDEEVQRRQLDESQAIVKIGIEYEQELEELRRTASFYQNQKPPASKLYEDIHNITEKCDEILKSLDELAAKSTNYLEELRQVKQFTVPVTDLKQAATISLLRVDPIKASAIEQQVDFQVLKAKLDQFAVEGGEEVVEDGEEVIVEEMAGGGEEMQEMEVAAEAVNEFTLEDLFSDVAYSQWLWGNSLLRRLFLRLNQEEFRPASLQSVIETFERVMFAKHSSNQISETEGIRPLDLDLTFVTSLLGPELESDSREFCEFVAGLQEASSNYAEAVTKLLGLHPTASTAPSFAAVFPALLVALETLFKDVAVSKEIQGVEKAAERDYENGGFVSISEALNVIFDHFRAQPALAASWARSLRPEAVPEEDYLLFLLCNRLKRQNTDSTRVFQMLTKGRFVDFHDFYAGLKGTFNLHLCKEDFILLFDRIDRKASGTVSRVSFVLEVKLQWYFDLSKRTDFLVSKANLLNTLLACGKEYMKSIVWETYQISKDFQSRDLEFKSDEMATIAAAFDVADAPEILSKVQKLGNCSGQDVFGFDELARYALKRPFGVLDAFALCKR